MCPESGFLKSHVPCKELLTADCMPPDFMASLYAIIVTLTIFVKFALFWYPYRLVFICVNLVTSFGYEVC